MENNCKEFYSKVIYKDNCLVKIKPINKDLEHIVEIEELNKMPNNIEIGDIVTEDFDDRQYHYKIVEKPTNKETYFDYKDVCIVKKIDDNYIYLLKNNNKKLVKIEKCDDVKLYDVGFLDNNNFKTDYIMHKYVFNKCDNNEDFKLKKHFSIKKYVVSYGYKNAVCLFNIEDFNDVVFEPIYKFNSNVIVGDIYYKVDIDKKCNYVLDEEDYDDLTYYYNHIILHTRAVDTNLTGIEKFNAYSKILQFQEYVLQQLENVDKKTLKYYKKNPHEFTKEQIVAIYNLEEKEEFEDHFGFRAILKESFDKDYKEVEVLYDYDLPKYARDVDLVYAVKDKNNNITYYCCNDEFKNDLNEAIKLTKFQIENCEGSL